MAEWKRMVDRGIPSNERLFIVREAQESISPNDIILVEESLGRPARKTVVEAASGGGVQFYVNVYRTVFPSRAGLNNYNDQGLPNVSQGVEYEWIPANAKEAIVVEASEVLTLTIPISTIRLSTTAGLATFYFS